MNRPSLPPEPLVDPVAAVYPVPVDPVVYPPPLTGSPAVSRSHQSAANSPGPLIDGAQQLIFSIPTPYPGTQEPISASSDARQPYR